MTELLDLFFLTGLYPLWRAWNANGRTTLRPAVGWAVAAWATWGWSINADAVWLAAPAATVRYVALCLTACAGVAVFGAQRPRVGAWNFVLLGLLAVMLLPLAEGLVTGGALHLVGPRLLFLGGTLAVVVLNYVPTRLGLAALVLAAACGFALTTLEPDEGLAARPGRALFISHWLLPLTPWAAYVQLRSRPQPRAEFDRLWLDFRDRYGLVWGQRVREQFNRAAANAGWDVVLRWRGLRLLPGAAAPPPDVQEQIVSVLRAVLKRFLAEDAVPPGAD